MRAMLDMKNKAAFSTPQPKKKRFSLRLLICLVLFLLVGTSLIQFIQGHKKLQMMNQQVKELHGQIQYMKYEKQKLLTMLDQLGSMEYVERIAREELGLVKKGETLIITLDE